VYTLESERRGGKKCEMPPKKWKGPLENGKSLKGGGCEILL
jgi:hypothetical protein